MNKNLAYSLFTGFSCGVKNIIKLLVIAVAVLNSSYAETVYVSGIGSHISETITPTELWPQTMTTMFENGSLISDPRGINSVTIQPFLNLYNENGDTLTVVSSLASDIAVTCSFGVLWKWWNAFDGQSTFSIKTDSWLGDDNFPENPTDVAMFAMDEADGGPWDFYGYHAAHPEVRTFSFGFDVLSYETTSVVAEPPTLMLIAGGIFAFIVFHKRVKLHSK